MTCPRERAVLLCRPALLRDGLEQHQESHGRPAYGAGVALRRLDRSRSSLVRASRHPSTSPANARPSADVPAPFAVIAIVIGRRRHHRPRGCSGPACGHRADTGASLRTDLGSAVRRRTVSPMPARRWWRCPTETRPCRRTWRHRRVGPLLQVSRWPGLLRLAGVSLQRRRVASDRVTVAGTRSESVTGSALALPDRAGPPHWPSLVSLGRATPRTCPDD